MSPPCVYLNTWVVAGTCGTSPTVQLTSLGLYTPDVLIIRHVVVSLTSPAEVTKVLAGPRGIGLPRGYYPPQFN